MSRTYEWCVATAAGLTKPFRDQHEAREAARELGFSVVRRVKYECEQCGREFRCVEGGEPDDLEVCSEQCRSEWLEEWGDSLLKGAER